MHLFNLPETDMLYNIYIYMCGMLVTNVWLKKRPTNSNCGNNEWMSTNPEPTVMCVSEEVMYLWPTKKKIVYDCSKSLVLSWGFDTLLNFDTLLRLVMVLMYWVFLEYIYTELTPCVGMSVVGSHLELHYSFVKHSVLWHLLNVWA